MKYLTSVPVIFTLASFLLMPTMAAADGGTVVRATGQVSVERQGQKLPVRSGGTSGSPDQQTFASPGFPLLPGDTLITGNNSNAQVRFDDDSVFSIIGGSALQVNQFQMPNAGNGGKAVFSLLRGGFRTITGSVGKGAGEIYEIRTPAPAATIRTLGTTYAAVLCKGDCSANGKFKEGLYIKAEKGIVIVTSNGGEIHLKAGQVAFVDAQGGVPVRVKASPFDNPQFAADYAIEIQYDYRVDPPRIEPEPPASPS